MQIIEAQESNQFSFELFASHTFYIQVNRSLVKSALARFSSHNSETTPIIVDLACGTGAITRLIVEEMARLGRSARIIGIDPALEALHLARKNLEGIDADVEFLQGEVSNLPSIVQNADAIFFCNAIHLVPDKFAAFRQVSATLAPGGIFACNSTFYEGAYSEGSDRFYRLWIRRAMGWLRKEHPEVRPTRGDKATARQWLTPEQYAQLLKQSNFQDVETIQECAAMTMESYRDIGQYWLFIEGALPGIPLALGARALGTAAYQAGEELGLTELPRNWLQIIATNSQDDL